MRNLIVLLFIAVSLISCDQATLARVGDQIESRAQDRKEVKPKAQKEIKTFTEAVLDGDPELFADIKKNAVKMFPDDYVTQEFVIEQQCKSYARVLNYPWKIKKDEHTDNIFRKANDDFGKKRDYTTMLFVLNQQLKAYIKQK